MSNKYISKANNQIVIIYHHTIKLQKNYQSII